MHEWQILLADKVFLRKLNLTLIVVICLVAVLFVGSLFVLKPAIEQRATEDDRSVGFVSTALIPLQNIAEYRKYVSSRQLFRGISRGEKPVSKENTIKDIAKDLLLVGVVSVDNKEAIIKNRRTRQSFFIKEGGQIGQLTVVSIDDSSVEIAYENERMKLFLQ